MPKLVIFTGNYADEFDVEEFYIYADAEWKDYLKLINKVVFPAEFYFGTNEACEFHSKKAFLKAHEVKDITEAEAIVLIGLLGTRFGLGVSIDKYYIEDQDEEY